MKNLIQNGFCFLFRDLFAIPLVNKTTHHFNCLRTTNFICLFAFFALLGSLEARASTIGTASIEVDKHYMITPEITSNHASTSANVAISSKVIKNAISNPTAVCVTTDCISNIGNKFIGNNFIGNDFNGIYTQGADLDGRPSYTNGTATIHHLGSKWYLESGPPADGTIIFEIVSAAMLPPTTGWSAIGSCAGASFVLSLGGCTCTTPIEISPSESSICIGGLITLESSGGDPDGTYSWVGPSEYSSKSQNPSSFEATSTSFSGVYSLTVTATTGCTATATATVQVNENPTVSISPIPSSICLGKTLVLTASSLLSSSAGLGRDSDPVSSDSYTWTSSDGSFESSPGNPLSWSSEDAGAGGFTFTVTATNTNSCSATATASVTVNPLPAIFTVSGDGVYCPNGADVMVNISGTENEEADVTYQIYIDNVATGRYLFGDGQPKSFGAAEFDPDKIEGVYTIEAFSNLTQCSVNMTGSATVTLGELPMVFDITGGGSICPGTTAPIGLANSETDVDYELYINDVSSGTIKPGTGSALDFGNFSAPGLYNIKATNASTCTIDMQGASDALGVDIIEQLSGCTCTTPIEISPSESSICIGGLITLTSVGGDAYTAGDTYSWAGPSEYSSKSQNPDSFTATSTSFSGVYSLTVTATTGCTATATATVQVNANPSVSISLDPPTSSICVGAPIQLSATLAVEVAASAGLARDSDPVSSEGYNWASSSGRFTSSTDKPNVSWLSDIGGEAIFSVTATNTNGCTATATATVQVNENPSVSISPPTSSICVGATLVLTASSPLSGSAGLAPTSISGDGYTWASSDGIFSSNEAMVTFSNSSSAGGFSFTVTATNSNSCSATATASVTVGNASISVITPRSICAGATINLTASGGSSYSWSGGDSFSSSEATAPFSSSIAGGYSFTVTATVSGGCTATATTSISVKAKPTVSINSPSSVCVGKRINLNASPSPSAGLAPSAPVASDSYKWASSGGGFVSSTGSPVSWSSDNAGPFIFTVTATNTNTCSASATASVTVNENPRVIISPATSSICVGQTLNLAASSPNPLSAGLSPSITSVSSDGYTWASSGGNFVSSTNSATFYSSSTGGFSFTVTATNINSCSATATASVTVGNASISVITPRSICAGATINLTASGGSSYSWSGGDSFSSSEATAPFSSSSPGGYSFTVTATVSGGCTATATTSVSVKAKPTVSIKSPLSVCVGKSINLNASSALQSAGLEPGSPPASSDGYAWASSGGSFESTTGSPVSWSSDNAGPFIFTVTATNTNTCSASATASVTVNANPSASISPATSSICVGKTLALEANGGSSYAWASSDGSFKSSPGNPVSWSSSIAGGFSFTVTATNSNSCSATATASVTVNSKPALSISQSNSQVCAGASISLTATNGLSNYSWVHSGGTFTSTTNEARFSSGAGGTFTFTVTAGNSSCSNSATTTVLVYGVSSATVSFAPICALGNPLNLSASGGSSYSWKGPNGFKSNIATPSKAKTVAKDEGIYSVTVTGVGGCTATSTIQVYIGVGKITATSNSTVCKGGTIKLSATAEFGASYKWTKQFSSVVYNVQNPSIPNAQPSNGGVYVVFVTGVNGCIDKQETLVVVSSAPCTSGRLASGEEVEGMEMEVNTYPNPTSKLVTVEVKLAKPSSLNLQLFTATGNTLNEWNLSEETTIHRKEIDLSVYKDGLYLIQAQSKDGKQTKRVVKMK